MLRQQTFLRQLIEIFPSRLTRDVQIRLDILDFRVGMPEQVVQQLLAVNLGQLCAHPLLHGGHLRPHAFNQLQGDPGCLGHGTQHVEDPRFPCAFIPHLLQQTIIFILMAGDVARQVEDRDIQKAGPGQIQHVQDPPDTAISIGEGMNALKLMVDQSHLDKWIQVTEPVIIQEPLQIRHMPDNLPPVLRRHKDHFPRALVLQGCSRGVSKPISPLLEPLENRDQPLVQD
ncbi:hypothetical protein NBRC3278_3316 [Acetobacter pasteurianus NBRC 3278]|uniref:Uncharacterized protein n=1 Tax=Acetobacter pasteurianus NBRC 3278 TaxID=1226660 RepID=A0A401X8Z4_ACEPA|nr:hypothetical protein NBRC3278_3316 [Acetobacter pasteurianus NBRC 3278]